MRTLLFAEADQHAGHRLGLLSPKTILFDETESGDPVAFTPALTATQKYLWELRTRNIRRVRVLKRKWSVDRVIYFHVGDATQGNAFRIQLVHTAMSSQVIIAVANFKPLAGLVSEVRFFEGTGVHTFKEGSGPQLIIQQLRGKHREVKFKVHRHAVHTIRGGPTVDSAHHGPGTGKRQWLKGNNLRRYLQSAMMDDLAMGQMPAAILLRAHVHDYKHERVEIRWLGKWVASDIFTLPAMCWMGEHARKVTQSRATISVGGLAFLCDGKKLVDYEPLEEWHDIRTREVI